MTTHPPATVRPALVALAAVLAVASAAALAPAAAATSANVLQPGDALGSSCTLNFVFDGADGDAYIGTAGHCVADGDRVSNPGVGTFGTVVYDNNNGDGDNVDFALIDVDNSLEPNLDPGLDGHPNTPTGVATPAETSTGDVVLLSGHGIGVHLTEPTREERRSVLVDHTQQQYQSNGPVVNGDSGAPFVHAPTGQALGVVSAYGIFEIPPTTDVGPTVDNIVDTLQNDGWDVSLRTAS